MSTDMSTSERQQGELEVAENGDILYILDLPALPERVFRALVSREITDWWVRPGVFDTREWTGDVRPGGRWRASGMFRGQTYVAEGEYLEVAASHRLVHTWDEPGRQMGSTTLTYTLEARAGGTRLELRQTGFAVPDIGRNFGAGWASSFTRLAEILAGERAGAQRVDAGAGTRQVGAPA